MTNTVVVPGLHEFPFAVALREAPVLYATIEGVHLLGVALLVGPVFAFDLRLLGLNTKVPVRTLARHLLPLAVTAMVLIIPTGLAMFAAHAEPLLSASTFLLKMILVLGGGALAIAFHTGPYRGVADWDTDATPPLGVRLIALASAAGWISVIFLGVMLR